MSSFNCCFLTCIQVSQEAGQVVWYSHLFQSFPQFIVIHTVKDFGIFNKAEVMFFWKSCFFNDPAYVANLISGPSAFSKTSLNICKFMVHILLKLAWRILSITLLACVMSAIDESKEQASLNFMGAVTICSDFGAPKLKSLTLSTVFPCIRFEVLGLDTVILVL